MVWAGKIKLLAECTSPYNYCCYAQGVSAHVATGQVLGQSSGVLKELHTKCKLRSRHRFRETIVHGQKLSNFLEAPVAIGKYRKGMYQLPVGLNLSFGL